ncbi:hypothetical protein CEQ90_00895 [Lewinellaceae bacterium SD302]|nr:hypothetical protein CEQ90_00895 [Lewinellaceae bacterium SD302]
MKPTIAYLALILLLTSCGQDRMSDADAMGLNDLNTETSTPAQDAEPAADKYGSKSLRAAFLPAYPAEIKDCYCALYLDGQPIDEEHYFFAFNRGNGGPGFIGINEQRVQVAPGASLTPAGSNYDSYLHEDADFKVQTSLTDEGAAGEKRNMYSGKVKVTDKRSGELTEFPVLGYCGCK